MSTFHTLRDQIQLLRSEQVERKEDLFLILEEIERLKPRLTRSVNSTTSTSTSTGSVKGKSPLPAKMKELGQLTPGGGLQTPNPIDLKNSELQKRLKLLDGTKGLLTTRINDITALLQDLFNQLWTLGSPQELVKNWEDAFPVLLLPIRVETRFLDDTQTGNKYLGVRFLPDDIFVDTHERTLTADEINAGKTFWTLLWDALGSTEEAREETRKGAWRALATGSGTGRAAYIILQTRPGNWPADESLPAPTEGPVYPALNFKNGSWRQPPRTYTLPDKFVVRLHSGAVSREFTGNRITAYPLVLGPDPRSEEPLFEEENGVLKIDPAIKWMFDFDQAVQEGMAVRIPLSAAEYNNGFDKVLVLGLRLTADAAEGQSLIQGLVDSHHYGSAGFGLLPQGTPTNNTTGKPSGFSAFRPDLEFAYSVEQKDNLIDNLSSVAKDHWKDGQWLAFGLGIDESFLQHIPFADCADRLEAMAMNKALWPATLGYYFKHLLVHWGSLDNNTLALPDIETLKTFFIQHISGRGSLPAFRVGNQPYGILPATAYSRMKWDAADGFAGQITKAMVFFRESWKKKVTGVNTVGTPNSNWQQNFLNILGLHAGSVEYHQRITIGPLLYFQFLINISAASSYTWLGDKLNRAQQIINSINNLDPANDLMSQISRASMLTWFPFGNQIKGDLITSDPLSESDSLRDDYIKFLSDQANTPVIVRNYLIGQSYSNTLLYQLLRHAFLLEIWEILWDKDNKKKWVDQEYLNLFPGSQCDSIWYHYANKDGYLNEASLNYLYSNPRYQALLGSVAGLLTNDHSLPTEKLERLLTEHLDICTYRIDAWYSGLADYRLNKMRSAEPKGAFLGAFGWLLNVRRDPPRQVVPQSEIPSQLTNTGETYPLTYETGNAGFIHAPSIAQATTGAVLREGYLSNDRKAMEVNISSKRVRLAREVIQGIQNGQELGALLGYRFEKSLHEKSAAIIGLELDKYIYPLRKKFPLTADADPNRQNAVEANNVVHGLNLIQAYRNGNASIQNFTAATGNDLLEIHNTLDELENIIDAIADLTMAEAVHQSVLGNHPRAGALLNSIGDGKLIPDPDFIETPRTGTALTQRVGLLFNAAQPASAPWKGAPKTPRANAAPHLNAWAGQLAPDPALVKCKVSYLENQGMADETEHEDEITLKDLAIQPIDLLFLLNSPPEDGQSELARRITYVFRSVKSLKRDVPVKIDFRNREGWTPDEKTFFEISALAKSMYKILTDSQVMNPGHLVNASVLETATGPIDYDLPELEKRLDAINLADLVSNLSAQYAIVSGFTDVVTKNQKLQVDKLRKILMSASLFGITGSIPAGCLDYESPYIVELLAQSGRVIAELTRRQTAVTNALQPASLDPVIRLEKLTEAIKCALGKELPVIPCFKTINYEDIKSGYSQRDSLLRASSSPLVVEDWLRGVAKVREKIKNWQMFTLLQESLGNQTADHGLIPLQMPYQANDQWLGVDFDEDKINIAGDPLSIVLNLPDGFPPNADTYCCGLVLDEWVEKIPYRSETTGIAFNYDEPNAEPPQALLLAIPPEVTGKWTWDDLMDTLNETLEMAQIRAVDPDLLGRSPGSEFNPFLPGVVSAITSDRRQTVALNFADLNATTLS